MKKLNNDDKLHIKKLGEVINFKNGKSIKLDSNGKYPIYGANGIIGSCNKFQEQNAIILGRVGAYCGSVSYYPGKFWASDNTIVAYPKNSKYDVLFLSYLLRKLDLNHWAGGAAQPLLTQSVLKQIEAPIPPFTVQRKIASILSAYDNLIENNLRRIKILEAMAQNLYREWFVKFRFPGHENARFVDSKLGRIPEGWEVKRLEDTCISIEDGDWIETKDQGGDAYRLLQVSNIGVGSFRETGNYRYITEETFSRLHCREVLPGNILIARMPKPTGRAWLVTEMPWRMITAVDVAIAIPDETVMLPHVLLHLLNSPEQLEIVQKHSTGTTRPRISRRNLCALSIVVPPLEIQKPFEKTVSHMFNYLTILKRKNNILRRTRDLLLPKLISGKVDVSDLDIDVPDEVEA